VEERSAIIEAIWDSLEDENLLTKEKEEELDRRIERHESGEGKSYTWEEIKDRLEFKLNR